MWLAAACGGQHRDAELVRSALATAQRDASEAEAELGALDGVCVARLRAKV